MRKRGLILMLAVSAGASAADHGFYAGGAWSSVSADYASSHRITTFAAASGLPEGSLDTSDLEPLGASAWRIVGGYRLLDWLAIEGNFSRYAGNGDYTGIFCVTSPCPQRERGEARSTGLAVLALYPHGPLDLYLRAGVTRWRAELSFQDIDGSRIATMRDEGTNASYGGGVQVRVSRVVTRLEYERVKFGADEAGLVTLGLACVF